MQIIFLAKHKVSAYEALTCLINQNHTILALVAPQDTTNIHTTENLFLLAQLHHIPIWTEEELYYSIENQLISSHQVDVVISFLFWKRIRKPLIALPQRACINFHPAPLPDFRGLGGYNFAIYENLSYWGVSAHWVDENFDTGDLIKVNKFAINPSEETCWSLEKKTQQALVNLFQEVIALLATTDAVPRIPQNKKEGRYINRAMMENLKKIDLHTDSPEIIERKIRACWFPPHLGAYIEVEGQKFMLIEPQMQKMIMQQSKEK